MDGETPYQRNLRFYKKLSEIAETDSDKEAMRILKDSAVDRIIRWNNKWNAVSVIFATVFYFCSLVVILSLILNSWVLAKGILGKIALGIMAIGAVAIIVSSAASIISGSKSSRLSERRKKDSKHAKQSCDNGIERDKRDD